MRCWAAGQWGALELEAPGASGRGPAAPGWLFSPPLLALPSLFTLFERSPGRLSLPSAIIFASIDSLSSTLCHQFLTSILSYSPAPIPSIIIPTSPNMSNFITLHSTRSTRSTHSPRHQTSQTDNQLEPRRSLSPRREQQPLNPPANQGIVQLVLS